MTDDDDDLDPTAEELRPTLSGPVSVDYDAPMVVPLDGTVPASLREHVQLSADRYAVLVAIDRETGTMRSCRAFPGPDGNEPAVDDWADRSDDDDELDPGPGLVSLGYAVDPFDELGLPRRPGAHDIYLLARDQQSAPLTLTVTLPKRMQDPATGDALGAQRRTLPAPRVWPPPRSPYPIYDDRVPLEPPASPGLVLAADPVLFAGRDEPAVLYGAFRLPVLPQDRLRPSGPAAHIQRAVGPKAVVPINVALLADDRVSLRPLPLAVPCQELVEVGGQTFALGRFAVDLMAFDGMWTEPQPVHVHGFAAGYRSEPLTLRIVDDSLLPRREAPKTLN